ncbi:hypothetical protein NEMIN01_1045 [Nematocida minor]|uniref:uncharacterized protein n=1 Tax=Nematocida minor TaxID=1912983 RepID=UPI00221F1034|nr:uncharacterized protein NEMIN01_1045 [Nematocida minor]KAI5190421.1 hypothetical protein NEMIN01_1045 [Nematocida minor]
MGLWFSKKSVREAIIELEEQIKEKEKEIKHLKKNKETAGDLFFKVIAAVSIGALSFLWVCKESISYLHLLKILFLFVLIGMASTFLYYANRRICDYRLNKKIVKLETLRERQRKNIESLKKETKYDETHGIIKRYTKNNSPEETVKEEAVENMVDKIVRLI